MPGRVDLHIHSFYSSDGDVPVQRIVHLAREKKMSAIAITDHDSTAAYPKAIDWGKREGVEVIPSIELTTSFDGREFHLLLPFVDWTSSMLESLIDRVVQGRIREARERVARLIDLGFDLTWEEVRDEAAPFAPLGVNIAQVILRKAGETGDKALELQAYLGAERTIPAPYAFYRDYFTDGKPAFVPRRNIGLLEALEAAPVTGGVPVLAHPGADFQRVRREDLEVLKARGLQGLEVYTSYHDPEQTRFYLQLARELDLIPTVGSDFHGSLKPHIPFGFLPDGDYTMVEDLRYRRP
jgi:predicted metal-dependent phosphoesterase TrpH